MIKLTMPPDSPTQQKAQPPRFQGPETGGRRQPAWRVLYEDKTISVTTRYLQVGHDRIPVSELHDVVRCLTFSHPTVKVAAVTAGLELLIAIPFAAAYGSAWTLSVGVLSALGMATGVWADHRRNPRIMTIEATVRGQQVLAWVIRGDHQDAPFVGV